MIYVKESIQNKQTDIRENTLECVGVHITLSLQMSFVIFTVLLASYCYKLLFFQTVDGQEGKEIILKGDINKARRKNLNGITKM